jgi:hypothetical protein
MCAVQEFFRATEISSKSGGRYPNRSIDLTLKQLSELRRLHVMDVKSTFVFFESEMRRPHLTYAVSVESLLFH